MTDKNKSRCAWCISNELMQHYHDTEWGFPSHDDQKHFEFLILEAAQAGLSWLTVLKRREGYKKAFANFNPQKVANFTNKDAQQLLKNSGIIRNKLKITAAINNAQPFLTIQKEFGSFDSYLWSFTKGKQVVHDIKSMSNLPAKTELSDTISKDLKKRGFSFVGSTIIYAHLQAVGIVNDHENACFRRKICMK